MDQNALQRSVIVGTTCSGKTTFARQLAAVLQVPHIELDALHWGPNWTPRPLEEFRQLVSQHLAPEQWVVDGNYGKIRNTVWAKATDVIWLNYPFHIVGYHGLARTIRRIVSQEVLFSGNRETFRSQFLSKDSLLLWMLTTFHRRRRQYRQIFTDNVFPHLRLTELRHPRAADQFLREIGAYKGHREVNYESGTEYQSID